MGFLNLMLLFGALAFVVPLIIHLLNRSKFQTVEWGAMHLLDNIELQNSKRIQWQALLLLLMRCLAPIVLAFCMARPIWNWWMASGIGGPSAAAFVLDNSFSMQSLAEANSSTAGEKTNFAKSIDEAKKVMTGLGGRSAKSVITSGGGAAAVTEGTSYDSRPIERQFDRIEALATTTNPAAALQMAIETVAKTQEPYRQVLLWSDFQKQDWEKVPDESWTSLKEQLAKLPVPASIHFFPTRSEQSDNVSLWIESETTELTLVGEPLEIRAVVANRGTKELTAVPIHLVMDEKEIAIKKVDLPAKGELQTSFLVTIDEPGTHSINLKIDDPSAMEGDDTDKLRVDAIKPLKVLLVEERNDLPLLELETGFLQLALQSTFREDGKPIGISLERIPASQLKPISLDEIDLVVLANVSRLQDESAKKVVELVEKGMTLMVFGGDQLDRNWYAQQWGLKSPKPILPFVFGEPIDAQQAKAIEAAKANAGQANNADPSTIPTSVRLGPPPYNEPALSLFNNPQQGRLDQASVKRWHRFDTTNNEPVFSQNAVTLLKLADETTLLSKLQVGSGTVFQWSVRANDAWTDLPVRPIYLPLIQRLVLFSKGTFEPHDVTSIKTEAKHDPMSQEEIVALAEKLGATVHDSADSFLKADSDRQYGWEIWRWVLIGLVALLFGELFLEKRITRGGA